MNLKTHYIYAKDYGYKTIESKQITISLGIDNQLNDTITLLTAYLESTNDLFNNQAWKDVKLNPAYGYTKITANKIKSTLSKLYEINLHMNTTLTNNYKRATLKCTYDLTLFQNTLIKEKLLGLAVILENSKKTIDAHLLNPVTFTRSDKFVTLSLELNSGVYLVENIAAIVNTFSRDLISMTSNRISEQLKSKISLLECNNNKALITSISIEQCQYYKNQFSCTATLTNGFTKVELYRMKSFTFSGCKIKQDFNIDDNLQQYSICSSPNCINQPLTEDNCFKGLKSLNLTQIKSFCPLENSLIEHEYQFKYHGIVFNYLSNETRTKLIQANIPIINLPFSIEGGKVNLTLETQISWNFKENFKIYNPVLPFKSSLLCPRKGAPKREFLEEATFNIPLLTLAALTNLLLVLFSLLLYKLFTCCCCKCNRFQAQPRSTRVLRNTEDVLLEQLHRRRR